MPRLLFYAFEGFDHIEFVYLSPEQEADEDGYAERDCRADYQRTRRYRNHHIKFITCEVQHKIGEAQPERNAEDDADY